MLSGVLRIPNPLPKSWFAETCVPMAFPDAVDSRRQSSTTLPTSTLKADPVWQSECERYVLWIDGVGAWQLCMGGQFLIGGPTLEHQAADICLLANLSRQHATLKRIREDWFIQPHAATVVSGRTITDQTLLKTGDQIKLAERVRLGFRIPSILSGSAVIDFESSHRPTQSVNGIILMTDTCLLGPRRDHHVCCPDWGDLVVLFRQDGQLRCRSKLPLKVNDVQIRDSAPLQDGAIVSCEDLRFRIEKMKDGNGPSGRST